MSISVAILFMFCLIMSIVALFVGLAAMGQCEQLKKQLYSSTETRCRIEDIIGARLMALENRGKIISIRKGEHE